jgi:type II restriction/modification system DNA methylase subunit YeeA
MNLTLLKNYAPVARKAFIEAVTRRAGVVGVHPDRVEPVTESGDVALIAGQPFARSIVPLRKQLVEIIQRDGFATTIEAMAYTWFNRLVAIRFMELHDGWLSHGYRVLSHPDGHSLPEIIQHAEHLDLKSLDRQDVIRLKLAGNRDEELYRILLLAQCAELNRILPDVFSRLDDATILLLPDNLLHSDSLVRQLVANSSEEDWKEVEVLGWLYQFYISEKKEKAMEDAKKKKRSYLRDEIPAVTQLFTPHWIVRYLVENSLGRLWLLNRPNSRLREHMPYYIEGEAETDFLMVTKPEDIRLCDPTCGSGHMLTYAFDLLVLIYEEEGYATHDIPCLILKHNLHGLDLCPRAAQLAELSLVFKAREKSRRFFLPDHFVRPNIIELKNIRFEGNELSEYFNALGCQPSNLHSQFSNLLHQFEEASNFGSLIQPCLTEAEIQTVRKHIQSSKSIIQNSDLMVSALHLKVMRVFEQAEALTQRYHVVVANPPYMGNGAMNPALKKFVEDYYELYKSDLFSAFIERGLLLTHSNGRAGFMSPFVWMFVGSYEDLRARLTDSATLKSLVQLEYSGFADATVPICCFVALNARKPSSKAACIKLTNFKGPALQEPKTLEAIKNNDCGWFYLVDPKKFSAIEGRPICFWASDGVFEAFESGRKLDDFAVTRKGMATGDNDRFVREWYEVNMKSIGFGLDRSSAKNSGSRWFPYANGGSYRKWFGNDLEVVNWESDGHLLQTERHHTGRIRAVNLNLDYIFQPGLSWTSITSSRQSYRIMPKGFLFSSAANSMFPKNEETLLQLLAFLNSDVAEYISKCLNPTLNANPGDVSRLPLIDKGLGGDVASKTAQDAISIARTDWDNFETSWDFLDLPLLRLQIKDKTLDASWRNWENQCAVTIRRMQELETENNRIFIAAYRLENALQPEVLDDKITLICNPASRYKKKAKKKRVEDKEPDEIDHCVTTEEEETSYSPEQRSALMRADTVREFLSYAFGCMMGRYSLDQPGLILADAGDTLENYLAKVGKTKDQLSFVPDADAIIPVLDGEWFDDDIVARTKEFLRVTFGESALEENLRFIEKALGKDLRDYFLTDFYKDHLQTYKNRPIYWLFSSGKQRAFQCLVYLHRYQEGTLARIRTEYVIPLQGKLAAAISRLEEEIPKTSSSSTRKKLQTELDKAKKQIAEILAYDEQLRSYADQRIALDLDDGVKVNYAKFAPLVAEAKKVCGTKDE